MAPIVSCANNHVQHAELPTQVLALLAKDPFPCWRMLELALDAIRTFVTSAKQQTNLFVSHADLVLL